MEYQLIYDYSILLSLLIAKKQYFKNDGLFDVCIYKPIKYDLNTNMVEMLITLSSFLLIFNYDLNIPGNPLTAQIWFH